jgi:SAM-dependent methyltransferase
MPGIEAFEQHAKEYDAWFERNQAAYEAELRAVKAALPSSGVGLEIGVGTGRFAAPLGIRVGIDPSPAMAAIARARGIEVVIAKAELLPLAAEEFDYVLMVTTICFVDDPGTAFREAARVLKSGGNLIVGFIDRDSPLGNRYAARKDRDPFYRHARFYSVAEVSCQLQQAGFGKPVASQTVFCCTDSLSSKQPVKSGHGEGSFVVLKATKQTGPQDRHDIISARRDNDCAATTHLP